MRPGGEIMIFPLHAVGEHAPLMRAIPGTQPAGALHASIFTAGKFVMTARTEVAGLLRQ
jgi:hypothetical protein